MAKPRYNITKKRLKKIPSQLQESVESEIKAILHAHRDCLRNQGAKTSQITFDVRDGYYGEAFGIIRCLQIQGYGYLGSSNLDALCEGQNGLGPTADGKTLINVTQKIQNLRWWLCQLEKEVLSEENFGMFGHGDGSHRCKYCLEKYGKDTASLLEKEDSVGVVEA